MEKEGKRREGRAGEGKGEDPLLSRYTPSHYSLDKGLLTLTGSYHDIMTFMQ